MKRLVLFCDGTWNLPDTKDRGKRKPSNVVKMVRAVRPLAADDTVQVTYYDPGVGTVWGLDKVLGGGFGKGLSINIVEAYRFLVHNHHPDDEVYLFGFSRGAYTVRSLVGLIECLGLLPKQHDFFMPEAYQLYRNRPPKGADQGTWKQEVVEFRRKHEAREIRLRFVGVWDTVGALGVPLGVFRRLNRKYQFHDVRLSPRVDYAYQALAIDERRKAFRPTLWEGVGENQVLEQRWFAGVHTNIGGGYANDGLANIPLHWLKDQATNLGLEVDEEFLGHYRPWFGDELRDSKKGLYKVLGRWERQIGTARDGEETIDPSVFRRMKHGGMVEGQTEREGRENPQPYHPRNVERATKGTEWVTAGGVA